MTSMVLLHRAIFSTIPGPRPPTTLIGPLQLSGEVRSIALPLQEPSARTRTVLSGGGPVTRAGPSLKSSQEWNLQQDTVIMEAFLPTAQTLAVITAKITQEALLMETTSTALGLQGKATLQTSTEGPPFGMTSSMIMGTRMAESSIEEVLLGKSLIEDPLPGKSSSEGPLLGKNLSEDPLLGKSLNIGLLPGKSLNIDRLLGKSLSEDPLPWKSLSEDPLLPKFTLPPRSTLLLLLLDMCSLILRCTYTITLRTGQCFLFSLGA